MTPSVDRVGRCFPLVLAAPTLHAPSLADCLGRHEDWFIRLEGIALSALDEGASPDGLDVALLAIGALPAMPPLAGLAPSAGVPRCVTFDGVGMPPMAFEDMAGDSAWWGLGSDRVAPCLARCRGWPPAAGFAALMNGAWRGHGWR